MEREIKPNVKLKLLLFEREISQKKLAFLAGIEPPRISDAIRYGVTTPALRKKISRALGVKEEAIFPNGSN
jgi:transcriptional regulator with XRE-family HTH domain